MLAMAGLSHGGHTCKWDGTSTRPASGLVSKVRTMGSDLKY
jgi:hypothetical protein